MRFVMVLHSKKFSDGELIGSVTAFAGNSLPDGWLLCNGVAVSRETYADLFSVIGTTYGAGDGNSTFNLPNLTNMFIEGSTTAGTVKAAGLPNITGAFSVGSSLNITTPLTDNAFTSASAGSVYSTGSNIVSGYGRAEFDASRSSSIYGNSNTVQPPALTMKYAIYSGVVSKKLWLRTV